MVKYKVTASSLNIRSSPTAANTSNIIGTFTKGTIVEMSSTTKYSNSWLKLNKPYNNRTAYVHVGYVTLIENESVPSGGDVLVDDNFKSKAKLVIDTYRYTTDSGVDKNGKSSSSAQLIKKGELVNITKKSTSGFYYIDSSNSTGRAGWIHIGAVNLTDSKGKTTQSVDKSSVEYMVASETVNLFNETLGRIGQIAFDATTYEQLMGDQTLGSDAAKKLLVKNLNGIHGVPYQFMDNVDRRLASNASLGRKYVERIVSKMPLLLLTPGSPDFLASYNKKEGEKILDALVNGIGAMGDNLEKILTTSGRYYTFKFNYKDYYNYVNSMLRMCAIYLGIQDKLHGNGYGRGYSDKLGEFKWQKAVNSELRGFINAQEYVAFYIDSETSISEDISTSTTTSSLMGAVNNASQIARELQFLAGPVAGLKVEALDPENFKASMDDIKDLSKKYLNNNRIFNTLAEQFTTVGKGGKIAFPEIWEDTEYSKTNYNISIKLRTPDADKLSWFLNICVPLIHLLGMGAARQLGPNGYRSPFLVRANYKGIINCDMGIITNMSITKGKEGAWTLDGLPTEVDVSITLKDLYSMLAISKTSDSPVKDFLNNTALMDYLANTCGVNINKPEIERTLETYILMEKNKIQDTYGNSWLKLQNGMSNLAATAYKRFAGNTN